MISDVIMDNLFPTPIGRVELPDSITKKEFEYISAMPRASNEGNATSFNKYVFNEPELKRLGTLCENAAQDFFNRVYAPKNVVNIAITQSWANYTEQGQYHHKHLHTNSFISGVLYVAADEESDRINFYRDAWAERYHIPTDDYNPWNASMWWYSVKPNSILLFPSNLTHMVQTKNTPATRISIAFNTFFKGTVGSGDMLSELIL